jgi:hypothetical protein
MTVRMSYATFLNSSSAGDTKEGPLKGSGSVW